MNKIFIFSVVLTFSACMMPPGGMMKARKGGGGLFGEMAQPVQQPQEFVDETVQVLTDPPGARIQVNDAFVGYSPVTTVVHRLWRGDPSYPMTLDTVKIEALPVAGGQCVQSGFFGQNASKTPSPVSFNMTACSASPAPAASEAGKK